MTRALFLGLLLSIAGLPVMELIVPEAGRAFELRAQAEPDDQPKEAAAPAKSKVAKHLKSFRFRSVGPAMMSGRIADIAIDQERPNTWYVAAGSGGLWKTTNAGTEAPRFLRRPD